MTEDGRREKRLKTEEGKETEDGKKIKDDGCLMSDENLPPNNR